jgi:hypothetical protein
VQTVDGQVRSILTSGVSRPPVEAPSDAKKAAKSEAVGTSEFANWKRTKIYSDIFVVKWFEIFLLI